MTFIVRTDRPTAGSVLTGLAGTTVAALQPLNDAAVVTFNRVFAPGVQWYGPVEEVGNPRWSRFDVPVDHLTYDGAFTSRDAEAAVLRDPRPGTERVIRSTAPTAPPSPRPICSKSASVASNE